MMCVGTPPQTRGPAVWKDITKGPEHRPWNIAKTNKTSKHK